jgi:hypothetical protein
VLPDISQHFSADGLLAGFPVRHEAAGSGKDCDPESVQNSGDLILAGINPKTGLGDALKAGDHLCAVGTVFEGDSDVLERAFLDIDRFKALDVTFVNEDLRDRLLHVGSGHIHDFVLGD